MPGLDFSFTADTADFSRKVRAIRAELTEADKVIKEVGKNFDISTPQASLGALQKVIRETESDISQSIELLNKWGEEAKTAFASGDMSTFNTISKDMEDQAQKISDLKTELSGYQAALTSLSSAAGEYSDSGTAAPMFFETKADFDNLKALEEEVANLQSQIAGYDPSGSPVVFDDAELDKLKDSLTEAKLKLSEARGEAVKAASALGPELGSKAAEASSSLYNLKEAVAKQQQTVESLRLKTEDARLALESLKDANADYESIDIARISYENLSASLESARNELANLQAQQQEASRNWQQVSAEIQTQDSVMVKMLGGYDNFKSILNQLPDSAKKVVSGITGMTGAAKAFIATPLGAILAAIILALQTLKTWFDSSVEGQMAFAKISGYVSGVLDQLKEIVISVGRAVYKAFSNPKEAVKSLWKTIKENFLNRIKGIGDMVGHLGGLLKAAFTFDSDKIKSELKALANSFLQIGTGVENATEKIGNFLKKTHEAAKVNSELSVEERRIEMDRKGKDTQDKQRAGAMMRARTASMDTSKSEAERKKALDEWKRLNAEQTKADKEFQQRLIDHQKRKMSLTTNSIEDENKLKDLENGLLDIDNQAAQREMMMTRMENRINRVNDRTEQNTGKAIRDIEKQEQKMLRDLKRMDEDLQLERTQNKINLMEEGAKKEEEQRQLDFNKEEMSLRRRMEDAIEAEKKRQEDAFNASEALKLAKNKKYNKKAFSDDMLSDSEIAKITQQYQGLFDDLKARQEKSARDRLKQAESSMREYLTQFGSYAEKRKAILEKARIEAEEALDPGDRLMILAKAKQEVAALGLESIKEGGPLAGFSDALERLSMASIDNLLTQLEKLRPEIEKTLNPELIREFNSQIDRLSKARITAGAGEGFFPTDEVIRKRAEAAADLYAAEMEVRSLERARVSLLVEGATETDPEKKALITAQIREMDSALRSSRANVAALRDTLKSMGKIRFADVEALAKGTAEAVEAASELADCFDDDVADGISKAAKALNTVVSVMDSVATAASKLTDKTTDTIAKTVGAVNTGMEASSASAVSSMQAIEKASAIIAIIGAAIQLATMVAGLLTSDKRHEKEIERLQDRVDALQRSYERLGKEAERAFSVNARRLMEEQAAALSRQRSLIQMQMEEEKAKKKSDKDAVKGYEDKLREIDSQIADLKEKAEDAIFGSDIKSQIEAFAEAYADAWAQGESRSMTARDTVRDMMRDMVRESIKAATQSSGAMAEIRRNLQRMFADGVLDMVEQTEIYAMADRLQRELDERFAWSADLLRDTADQQKASVKAWEGMSAEDAGVLQGRFTAFCETSEGIRSITAGIYDSLNRMQSLTAGGNTLLESCLAVHINNMAHLETISRNTRELITMREDLNRLRIHVQNNL